MIKKSKKITEIKEFYVCSFYGLKFFDSLIPFGSKIDLTKQSAVLRQNLYNGGLIGDYDQMIAISQKFRIERFGNIDRKDVIEGVNKEKQEKSNLPQKNVNLTVRRKLREF